MFKHKLSLHLFMAFLLSMQALVLLHNHDADEGAQTECHICMQQASFQLAGNSQPQWYLGESLPQAFERAPSLAIPQSQFFCHYHSRAPPHFS